MEIPGTGSLTYALFTPDTCAMAPTRNYLTPRQKQILEFIGEFRRERGYSPTHREICERFGFTSYGTVYKHLKLLREKGFLRRDWNQKRGVELTESPAARASSPRSASSAASPPAGRSRRFATTRRWPCRRSCCAARRATTSSCAWWATR